MGRAFLTAGVSLRAPLTPGVGLRFRLDVGDCGIYGYREQAQQEGGATGTTIIAFALRSRPAL